MLGHRTLNAEDYLAILKRRGWIILIPLIILPILTFSASFTVAPQYLSQSLVLIEGQKVPDNYVRSVISSDLVSRLASMQQQVLSRSRLQPIVERFNLYAENRVTLDDRIDMIRKNIEIKPISSEIARGLPGFFITFKAGDAHTAQAICQEITSLFQNENLKSREDSAQGTTDFIKSQLADAKRNLDEQDARLAEFQQHNAGRLPDENAPNFNMLTSMNTQLEATTQQLSRMEQDKSYEDAMLTQQIQNSQAAASAAIGQAQVITGTPTSAQLQLQQLQLQEADLTSHYTEDYPDVVAVRRKIADLRRQIAKTSTASSSSASGSPSREDTPAVQQLRAHLRALTMAIEDKRREQTQLQGDIRTYQSRIQASPLVEEQYKLITRDHQQAQAFYDDLLGKMNQSKMATDLEKRQQGEQLVMVDAANLPDAPFSPKRSAFLIAGAAAGLGLGLLIVAFLEYKDTALRTERDVYAFTKLPTLAIIAYSGELEEEEDASWLKRFLRRKPPAKETFVTARS